ncbi:hypothetical protein DFH29DRAFT_923572 [Suillus ampliporus]|nr:hypothetical protein DFH29DRAFT_923572 [Suillus ampliporus]
MRLHDNPPPYYPRSSETDPLVPRRSSHRHQSLNSCICTALIAVLTAAIAVVIFASVFSPKPCNDPLDPDVRDRIRKEWDIELRQHQQDILKRVDTEKRWRLEDNERFRLREQWGREEEEHKREVEERRKREQDERLRLNMFWTEPVSHTCTTYATREYTARLVNVPSYYDRRVEACMATPVQIHGTDYTPKWCEDHGSNNVIGHWEVQQEPDCASYWNDYKDFGCVSPGSGQRRVEHHLANLPSGGDWREFCATTPVSFRGMHFTGAEFCFQTVFGVWGHWVFDDESCN